MAMNLLKQGLQKIGMVAAVLLLWILDDFIPVLPDSVVWTLVDAFLKVVHFGQDTRIEGLKEFWSGQAPK